MRVGVLVALVVGAAVAAVSAYAAVGSLTFNGCVAQETGCTTPSVAGAVQGAQGLSISSDGQSVYVDGSSNGDLAAFDRNPSTGALSFTGCFGTLTNCTAPAPSGNEALEDPWDSTVSPDGTSVYVSNYNPAVIDWFSRNTAGGALTYEGCYGNYAHCTNTSIPTGAIDQPEEIAVSPDGTSVYVVSYSGNTVDFFSRNTSTGALTYENCYGNSDVGSCVDVTSTVNSVDRPDGIAVSPDGNFVYVASDWTDGFLDVFSRNTQTGALTFADCYGSATGCTALGGGTSTNTFPHQLAISADGSNLYSTDGNTEINSFSRNIQTGALTFLGCLGFDSPCTGITPANALGGSSAIAISSDGDNVYAAGFNSYAVGIFNRSGSGANGNLSYGGCVGNHNVSCAAITPSDALYFPQYMAISGDGSSIYVASDASSGTVALLQRQVPPIVCQNASASTSYQTTTTLSLSCSDSEGLPLSYSVASGTAHGTLGSIGSDGQVTYTPASGYSGGDSFTFTATDSEGTSNTATATITVGAAPVTPAAPPPSVQTQKLTFDNQSITVSTLAASACTASSGTLSVTVDSSAIKGAKGTKLKFVLAQLYIDKGIKHTQHKHRHTKTTYSANATTNEGGTVELSLAGLTPGTHTLKVTLTYEEQAASGKHKHAAKAKQLSKTVPLTISVCQ
ncbi:MAG: beta-propeller fold lactonase family protein [Solirubrobacteraceae bacterium]